MLNTASAYSVSPKGLLDLSTGRPKEELTLQKGREFWGDRALLQSTVYKLGMPSLI